MSRSRPHLLIATRETFICLSKEQIMGGWEVGLLGGYHCFHSPPGGANFTATKKRAV